MIINTLRNIGMFFDSVVYKLVEIILTLIMDLADVEIFTDSVITEFASRIYVILGLVMLFKIMMSFIQILVNPDKMDDKEQGVGNVLKRVVISLVLIVLVPSIFDLARQVQSYIVPVIPKVVLGVNTEADGMDETMNSAGRLMAWYSFSAFFTYSPGCEDGTIMGTGGNASNVSIWNVSTAWEVVNDKDCPTTTDSNGYHYQYSGFVSTVVGVYLVYVLVQVAVAIAIRAIKLAICEFIAPIPIASYIDPKTSKQAFDNWVSTSVKTYLDLFIRLIVVYFVVFVFSVVFKAENLTNIYSKLGGDWGRAALVTLFIIIGLLQFAKQAPKFISDMLGIKGGGDIAGMFKGAASMFAATTKGAYDIARSNYTSQKERLESQGKKHAGIRAVGSALAGVGSSTARMLRATAQGKTGKDMRAATFDATVKARNNRNYRKDVVFADPDSYNRSDYRRDKRRERLQIPSTNQAEIESFKFFGESVSAVEKAAAYGSTKADKLAGHVKTAFTTKDIVNDPSAPDGTRLVDRKLTLAELKKLSERQEGEMYINPEDGAMVRWDTQLSARWSQAYSDAKDAEKYNVFADRCKAGDSEARMDYQNITRGLLTHADQFNQSVNDENIGEIYLSHINKGRAPSEQMNMDSFISVLKSDVPLDGAFVKSLKDAGLYVQEQRNIAQQNAQAREQMFNRAKQSDGK